MPTIRTTTRDSSRIADALAQRVPFTTSGALSGEPGRARLMGRLPAEYLDSIARATYVVTSYATPIAWLAADGWHVPDERYSVTTSRHQSKVRLAIHWTGEEVTA